MKATLALEFHHLRINFCTFVTPVIKFPSWKPKPYFAFHSTGRVVVNTLTDEHWAPQVCITNSTDMTNAGIFAILLKVVFPIFPWSEHFLLTVQRLRGRLTEMLRSWDWGSMWHVILGGFSMRFQSFDKLPQFSPWDASFTLSGGLLSLRGEHRLQVDLKVPTASTAP